MVATQHQEYSPVTSRASLDAMVEERPQTLYDVVSKLGVPCVRAFEHVRKEHQHQPVNAVIVVGDMR